VLFHYNSKSWSHNFQNKILILKRKKNKNPRLLDFGSGLSAIVDIFILLLDFNFFPYQLFIILWIKSYRCRQPHRSKEAPAANFENHRRESHQPVLTPVHHRTADGFQSSLILPTASSLTEPLVFFLRSSPLLIPLLTLPLPLKMIKVRFSFRVFLLFFRRN